MSKNSIPILSLVLALTCARMFAGEIEVVSRPHSPTPQSTGDSLGILLSADGQWAVFSSTANGLVPGHDPAEPVFQLHVYLKNLQSGEITLVSKNAEGAAADGISIATGISSDGLYLVFESDAPDLVPDDTNESSDIFLFNRSTGAITQINTTEISSATGAAITGNGRYVFYEGEIEGVPHYFRFDTDNGATIPAVARPDGEPWAEVLSPIPSADGRYVSFLSVLNPVAESATNGVAQLFLHDVVARTNKWLSVTVTNEAGFSPTNGPASFVSDALISPDNSVVAFVASDLLTNVTQPAHRLYLYSISEGALLQIPLPANVPAALAPRISAFDVSNEGRFAAFTLAHLPDGGTRYLPPQLYLYDRTADAVSAITSLPSETSAVVISADGNRVLFTSQGDNVAPGVASEFAQLYLLDRTSGDIRLISVAPGGEEADSDILGLALNASGAVAGFETLASNLSSDDDPLGNDVFVSMLSATNTPSLVSAPHPSAVNATASGTSELDFSAPHLSLDGKRVLILSSAPDLAADDLFSDVDLFLADLASGSTDLLTQALNLPNDRPVFIDASADLNRVVFGENGTLYCYDRNARTVSPAAILPDGTTGRWVAFTGDLTSDGRFLVFQVHTMDTRDRPDKSVYVRDLDGQVSHLIEHATSEYRNAKTLISGAGRYVLHDLPFDNTLVIDRVTGATNQLEMIILSSSADDSILLGWGGSRAHYPSDQRALWAYRPASREPALLTTNGAFPALSGNGSVIVYSQRLTNEWRSFIYETATGTTTPMTVESRGFRFEQTPAVSFDGRFIAFSIHEDAPDDPRTRNLYVYDRVLTNLATVTTGAGSPIEQVQRVALSADGRTIVFDSSNRELVLNDRNEAVDTFVARLPATDADNDSLEDGWEMIHFGSLQQSASADADSDGVPNSFEFLAATDPMDARSQFRLSVSRETNTMLRLEWPSAPGKAFQVQQTGALTSGSWTDIGEPVTATGPQCHALIPGAKQAFYRVKLVP